jgi:hypothetical protein
MGKFLFTFRRPFFKGDKCMGQFSMGMVMEVHTSVIVVVIF